jgi:3-phenylpropionate/trans-cinnamate dioxygenase ferredoxin reductase subunit
MSQEKCVIVGASHAGVQLAMSLRQGGWSGKIQLVSDESVSPYQRPPLSKGVLDGSKTGASIPLRPQPLYEKSNLEFVQGRNAIHIDTHNQELELDDGTKLPFDKLALTPGSRPRVIPLKGSELEGVFYLRALKDVERIRTRIKQGQNAVIIGGGYIGLEAAAVLRKCEMNITVIEALPRVLQRVTAPKVSGFYQRIHTEEGVTIITDSQVVSIEGNNQVEQVVCSDGSRHQADLVIIAVGVVPNTELAADAGLEVDNGIRVNQFAQCSKHGYVAAGDCTSFYSSIYHRIIRLESVQNATDQAKIAAASLNGSPQEYHSVPWFWSEQYDVKLQIAGLSEGYDSIVVRGLINDSQLLSSPISGAYSGMVVSTKKTN